MAIATTSLVSCAMGSLDRDRVVFHSLQFGNDGTSVVTNVRVNYGGKVFPEGFAHHTYDPNHQMTFSESHALPVPQVATVFWTSADGRDHKVEVPVGSLIEDAKRFAGFRFFFVDDHVDVYVRYKKPGWPKILDVDIKKSYSSPRS